MRRRGMRRRPAAELRAITDARRVLVAVVSDLDALIFSDDNKPRLLAALDRHIAAALRQLGRLQRMRALAKPTPGPEPLHNG